MEFVGFGEEPWLWVALFFAVLGLIVQIYGMLFLGKEADEGVPGEENVT